MTSQHTFYSAYVTVVDAEVVRLIVEVEELQTMLVGQFLVQSGTGVFKCRSVREYLVKINETIHFAGFRSAVHSSHSHTICIFLE